MKHENHIIISIDAEKIFHKIQHTFIIKILNNMGTEGMYLKIIRAIYGKPTANIISTTKTESISSKIGGKTRMPTVPTFIHHSTTTPSHSNKARKRNIMHPKWKEEVELSLFADDILHIENP